MTNLRQAAQQALEALESSRIFVTTREKTKHPEGTEWYDSAITALRTALEQPEQGPTCPECKAAVLYECVACSSNNYPPKPEQEPVASIYISQSGEREFDDWKCKLPIGRNLLYTTPPAAQAAPVQEPVVFYRCNGCGHAYEQVHPTSCDCMDAGGFDRVEYFTTPPAAQPAQLERTSASFDEWWDGDYDDLANPYHTGTPAYWAWAGWVGRTDDQLDEIAVIARRGNLHDLRIAIEAKLKERNT